MQPLSSPFVTARRTRLWNSFLSILAIIAFEGYGMAQKLAWEHAFRSSQGGDFGNAVAVDSTGVYIAGGLGFKGMLPGQTNIGSADGYVEKYDFSGNLVWTREFGTETGAIAYGVATGGDGVYVVGEADGTFPGQAQDFSPDAYVIKFDRDGNQIWLREFGTTETERALAVAADSSGVYVVGETQGSLPGQMQVGDFTKGDVFVRKYDPNGTELWTHQFGTTSFDRALAVAVHPTGVYVVGDTGGMLPNAQADSGFTNFFVRKYDSTGNELWTRQFGPGRHARGAAADSTGVYLVGDVQGHLPDQTGSGGFDAWVRKYDLDGNVKWTHQFGTGISDVAYAAAADGTGVYVAGGTYRALPGQHNSGGIDSYIRKYDPDGNEIWTNQFGAPGDDHAAGVGVNATGAYLGGQFGGGGKGDIFVAKIGFGPVLFDGGVVNNASFVLSPAPVAPGSIAALFGTNLNDGSQILFSSFGTDGKLVTTLGDASVTVDDIPAPLFYSTPGQLGIQIPYELATNGAAKVQVTVGGVKSATITIPVDGLAPGIFTTTQDGKGAAAALHSDGKTSVSPAKPAKPGEIITLFGTGLGLLSPSLGTGEPSTGNNTGVLPTVTVDGQSATVKFSGAAPGFVGLNQVNIQIPSGTRTASDIPVVLTIANKTSNTATIAVAP